jgi:hypothetical protein
MVHRRTRENKMTGGFISKPCRLFSSVLVPFHQTPVSPTVINQSPCGLNKRERERFVPRVYGKRNYGITKLSDHTLIFFPPGCSALWPPSLHCISMPSSCLSHTFTSHSLRTSYASYPLTVQAHVAWLSVIKQRLRYALVLKRSPGDNAHADRAGHSQDSVPSWLSRPLKYA